MCVSMAMHTLSKWKRNSRFSVSAMKACSVFTFKIQDSKFLLFFNFIEYPPPLPHTTSHTHTLTHFSIRMALDTHTQKYSVVFQHTWGPSLKTRCLYAECIPWCLCSFEMQILFDKNEQKLLFLFGFIYGISWKHWRRRIKGKKEKISRLYSDWSFRKKRESEIFRPKKKFYWLITHSWATFFISHWTEHWTKFFFSSFWTPVEDFVNFNSTDGTKKIRKEKKLIQVVRTTVPLFPFVIGGFPLFYIVNNDSPMSRWNISFIIDDELGILLPF